jgi:16S rRNA (guanine527-N7)-methyltransferase
MNLATLSNEQMEDVLAPYGISADPALLDQIRVYTEVLRSWNDKIALTAVTDPLQILKIHFGESFFAASAAQIGGGRLADIGTGAGFPGIPIRMVRTGIDLTLVESIAKKTAFLAEVIRRMNLPNVNVMRSRMEDVQKSIPDFDYITARALGHYERLLNWSESKLSVRGRVVLLLGHRDADNLAKTGEWDWQSRTSIPGSDSRVILVGRRPKL